MRHSRDRRRSQRFPIVREIYYQLLGKRACGVTGNGKTLNISSSGALFTCGSLLRTGQKIQLSINWPARLNGELALTLVVCGRVVRSEPGRVAMRFEHHEFRTRGEVLASP